MNKDEVLNAPRMHKATLARRFGVTELALFGSIIHEQTSLDSDIDILVSFRAKADWHRYFGVLFYLEDLLGSPVELATGKARRPELRAFVER